MQKRKNNNNIVFQSHMERKHNQRDTRVQCLGCNKRFATKRKLETHIADDHSDWHKCNVKGCEHPAHPKKRLRLD